MKPWNVMTRWSPPPNSRKTGNTAIRTLKTVRARGSAKCRAPLGRKLGESGEADAVRARHRDHYTALAAALDSPAPSALEQRIEAADIEIDNLRAAFAWSLKNGAIEAAFQLASALQPLWLTRGRMREGVGLLGAALADANTGHPEV